MFRIELDWPQQEAYNLLFNSLQWSLATGALFGLTAITAAQSRFNHKKAFLLANLLGVVAVIMTFLALYLPGGTDTGSSYAMLPVLATIRVSMSMLISVLIFIVVASFPQDQSDIPRSLFMFLKAFFIALIYGLVIMGGASGVAGAIQSLLYHDMSSKVYMYIGTLAGFLSFTIFLGYFPHFRKGQIDPHREVAQKQPRFIEILFGYILIPIMLALTVVLLLWAGQTIITGTWSEFTQLSSITASYALGGILLHIMVTHHESALAKIYRRIYPVTALVILAFEAWALVDQVSKYGLKTAEYYFILVWIIAVTAAVLLLVLKAKAHTWIIALTCFLAAFSVLPGVGYQALPVASQVYRLESLLVSQGMLEGGQIAPATTEPERAVKEKITDAVSYLVNTQDAALPTWFDKRLGENEVFETKLGFSQTWPQSEDNVPGGYMGINLMLPAGAIDINGYRWMVNMQDNQGKGEITVTVNGDKGLYEITWTANRPNGIPSLKVALNGHVIIEQDLRAYLGRIEEVFPLGQNTPPSATLEDMSLALETPEVSVLLVFSNIDVYFDPSQDTTNYWLNLYALYLQEK